VGPNGAGKTTILKLLAKITKPTAGKITVNGRLSALIELGAGFHPDLTGRENIYLNGTILGLRRTEIKRQFDEIVAFSELEQFIDTPVKRYSSGMTVRLGFAVASCIEPDILLVDEILAVGDAKFRQKCINRIQALINRGTGIVFVSHNLWLVQSICATGLYLQHGEVKLAGAIGAVIDAYDRALSEQRAQQFESDSADHSSAAEVDIVKVEVVDTAGKPVAEFSNQQAVTINVHYIAYRTLEDVTAVVRILRSDGLTCCMMRSRLDEVQLDLARGNGVLSVTLDPLQLRGGTYFVQAIIRDTSDLQGLAVTTSDWFYVAGSVLSYSDMNGVFEPNRRWHHDLSVPYENEAHDAAFPPSVALADNLSVAQA
ncbi:MAG: ABC transporter ATP-binding protein, partial [Caldilineaceae bacterium]|nr:ABC transporter ATP-binding protein [Caldilineaceae bacterium]